MGEPLIQIPTAADLPADMREYTGPRLKPVLPKVRAEDIPDVLGWGVLVLPVAIPRKLEGSKIELVADTIRHMGISRRVGMILAMGDIAFSERRGYLPGDRKPSVGDWVIFHEDSGFGTTMNGADGDLVYIKIIPDRDLAGIPKNPDAFMVMV